MLLLEYLLRRRDVGPPILLELHEPLERREIPARSIAVSRLGPNSPKIEKETTHGLLS